jgi:hypothetical protein
MHPVNNRNFGAKAGKLAVKFHDGSSVKTGWIVAQVATKRYKVTDGTTTKICTLAQTPAEVTALSTGPNALCTIEITPFGGSVENVKKLDSKRAMTVQGSNVMWALGTTATAIGQGTVALRANAAPTIANAIPDQVATVAAAYSYVVPANTFADLNGDKLTYAATISPSTALPAYLVFNATSRTFTKAAGAGTAGTLVVRVTASDGTASVYDEFNLVIS